MSMNRGRAVAIAFIVTLNLVPLGSDGDVLSEPLTVIQTIPDQEYLIGDEVLIQAHVFMHAERVDPDAIRISIGISSREVTPERLSVGHYEARVVIIESDISVGESSRHLPINTGVSISDPEFQHDFVTDSIPIGPFSPYLIVRLSVPEPHVSPPYDGQEIEYMVTFLFDINLVDPDPGSLVATLYDIDFNPVRDLETWRIDRGMYGGSYSLPVENGIESVYEIVVQANYTDDSEVHHGGDSAVVTYVPFSVWYNYRLQDSEWISIEIYVHDIEENPVENALITFNATYETIEWGQQSFKYSQITDEEGVGHFLVSYQDIDPYAKWIRIKGEVEKDDLRQNITFYVPNTDRLVPEGPSDEGFDVTLINDVPIREGSVDTLSFYAQINGTGLKGTPIDCYFYTDHMMLMSTRTSTDDDGRFDIELPIPEVDPTTFGWYNQIQGIFKVDTDSGYDISGYEIRTSQWDNSWEYLHQKSPETYIELTRINDSGRYEVKMISTGLDGINESVRISWWVGEFDEVVNWTDPGWYHSSKWSWEQLTVELEWDGEAYSGYIELPYYVPDDVPISMRGSVTLLDQPSEPVRYAIISDSSAYLENESPTVVIQSPRDGDQVTGNLTINGTATDDKKVQAVMIRIDGGPWEEVIGTEVWQTSIDLKSLSEGPHILEAISFDGIRYSDVDEVEFEYSDTEHQTNDIWPLIIIIIIILVSIVAYLKIRRDYSSKNEQ
ncbi:MAG: hypothetical protein KAJ35_02510 [Thermoplasmata archaeon]|nr:hypothetical protein [Thermoplasmata archaeon]